MEIINYDLNSFYKSIWLFGHILITWCNEPRKFSDFHIGFYLHGD